MKKHSLLLPAVFMSIFILFSCNNEENKATENETSDVEQVKFDFPQPDGYFYAAKEAFQSKDFKKAISEIKNAIEYIKTVRVEKDYKYADLIINANADLDSIVDLITEGKIDSVNVLSMAFARADQAIGQYHMFIVEDWLKSVDKNEESKIRMQRAIVRIENAVNHAGLQLNDGELKEYNKAKDNLRNGTNSMEEWWLKTKDNFNKLNARMDAGMNSLDGSM